MIWQKNILFLLSAGVIFFASEVWTAKKKTKKTRTPVVVADEPLLEHRLLRLLLKNDECRLYSPWSDQTTSIFGISNDSCWRGCKIVADLYKERHPLKPRLIRSGGCKKGLKIIYLECKCELTDEYARFLKWRTLKHCAHTFLKGIVDFDVDDSQPKTELTTETYNEDDFLHVKASTQKDEPLTRIETLTTEPLMISEVTTSAALTTSLVLGTKMEQAETEEEVSEAVTTVMTTTYTTIMTTAIIVPTTSTRTVTTTTPSTTSTITTTVPPTTRKKKKRKPHKPWRRNG